MDTTALRAAYEKLLETAAFPDLGEATDGGWNADQILAHILSIDAGIAATALGVVSGARPSYDNRIALDDWNLSRIISEHSGRVELMDHVRRQALVLADIADQLNKEAEAVLVPAFFLSGKDELLLDQPITLADLINGLAENHVPDHTQQLLALRATEPASN